MKKLSLLFCGSLVFGFVVGLTLFGRGHVEAAPSAGCTDEDGDGYGMGCAAGLDCNDSDPAIHPGATETCNFKDDNCSGVVDESLGCSAPTIDPSPVTVPEGSFLMGSSTGADDEKPVHRVSGPAFTIDRYEVTNARFAACVQAGACTAPALLSSSVRPHYFDSPDFVHYPVIHVSWEQAAQFCTWAGGRLPSEAEWERAARGTDSPRTFPWGDSAPDCSKANMLGCVGDTDRVGRRAAGQSPYGIFDMAGNVWEWTADWYDDKYYRHSPERQPTGPETGTLKVMRGGCWMSGVSSLTATCRKPELPASWAPNVGFRCVYPQATK